MEREAGLADSTRTDQRDEAGGIKSLDQLLDLLRAANETAELRRQVVPRPAQNGRLRPPAAGPALCAAGHPEPMLLESLQYARNSVRVSDALFSALPPRNGVGAHGE